MPRALKPTRRLLQVSALVVGIAASCSRRSSLSVHSGAPEYAGATELPPASSAALSAVNGAPLADAVGGDAGAAGAAGAH